MARRKNIKQSKGVAVELDYRTMTISTKANNIRNWRLFRGIATQRELAALTERADPKGVGLQRVTICRLENGDGRYNQDHIEILAKTLRVSPRDLIGTDPMDAGDVFAIYAGLPEEKKRRAIKLMLGLKR